MAKSLRSKHIRKMKAIKRTRYAVKELAQLKTVLAKKPEILTVAKLTKIRDMMKKTKTKDQPKVVPKPQTDDAKPMDVDAQPKKYNKFLQDENGNYPIWLNPKKIKKIKASKKMSQKKNKNRSSW